MTSVSPLPCPHERRPGTSVCLHCRHAERVAARERRVQLFGRFLLTCVTLTVLGAAGVAGASAFNERRIADVRTSQLPPVMVAATAGFDSTVAASSPLALPPASGAAGDSSTATAADTSAVAPADTTTLAASSAPPLEPIVAIGRHALTDKMFAVRSGDTVRVHFDMTLLRTRRADKLERIIRATLPEIYGKPADSLLAAVPTGRLVDSSSLLSELPVRGLHLSLGGGWAIALWPETRPGEDGPLVVSYRTMVAAGR